MVFEKNGIASRDFIFFNPGVANCFPPLEGPGSLRGGNPRKMGKKCEILLGFLGFQFQDGSDGEVNRLLS